MLVHRVGNWKVSISSQAIQSHVLDMMKYFYRKRFIMLLLLEKSSFNFYQNKLYYVSSKFYHIPKMLFYNDDFGFAFN